MTKPRLIYFDAPVSRGEECRHALHVAGVDFEDVRIKGSDWPAMKEQTPYGGLPVLELPGHPPPGASSTTARSATRSPPTLRRTAPMSRARTPG